MENGYEISPLSLEEKLALVRSKLWTPELDKLLRRWKRQIDLRRKGHIKLSRQYDKKHYILGVPATVLSTITTTGTLTTFQDCSSPPNSNSTSNSSFWCTSAEWIRLAMGIIGIIAVILTGIVTFMNFQKAAQDHKKAADGYESLVGTIDSILTIPRVLRGDPVDQLKLVRDHYDSIIKEAPTLNEKYKTELGFDVIGNKKTNNEVINISTAKVDPNKIKMDDRDIEMINKDKNVLKEILKDIRNKKNDGASKKSDDKIIKNTEGLRSTTLSKVFINENLGEINSEECFSSTGDELEKRNYELEQINDFDSEDESQEVCIGFDIDKMAEIDQNTTLIAIANLQSQRDRQVQESLNQALVFEMNRMNDLQRKSPRISQKLNNSRDAIYDYNKEYLGENVKSNYYNNEQRKSPPNRSINNISQAHRRRIYNENTPPGQSFLKKSQQTHSMNNSGSNVSPKSFENKDCLEETPKIIIKNFKMNKVDEKDVDEKEDNL